MKKVINGKLYDTETAELIDSYSNDLGNEDVENLSESLYKKKNGEFFLAGTGGAWTKYAEVISLTHRRAGSKIIPLFKGGALEWMENFSGSELVLKHFPDIKE